MINLGELLQSKREEKGLTIRQVSENTKIAENNIKLLEEGKYDLFPSSVYLKGFLKNYAKFLGIDESKILALYRRENLEQKESTLQEAQKPLSEDKPLITPGRIVFIITAITIISIISFIAIQINKVIQPPDLNLINPIEITAPGDGYYETDEDTVTIKGNTEVGSNLFINGNEVVTNNLQEFIIDDYKLSPGSNKIVLVAESYYFSKTSQIQLNIFYKTEEIIEEEGENQDEVSPEEENEEEEPTEMDIKINIENEEAWVVVDIDGENKLAQVLQPGESYEFKATETAEIFTPRPQIVNVTVNSNTYEINPQVGTRFKIEDGKITVE